MPPPPVFVIVIIPELVKAPPTVKLLRMPSPLFDIVIVPLLLSVPILSMAMLLTAFDSVIVPPESLVMVPPKPL